MADTRTSAGGLPELEGAENTAGWTDVDGSAVAAGNHDSATVLVGDGDQLLYTTFSAF